MILMHLTAIAEQFNKLKQERANNILNLFDDGNIKGIYDVRTYIAHDYEGVNLAIVEWIIRNCYSIIFCLRLKVVRSFIDKTSILGVLYKI